MTILPAAYLPSVAYVAHLLRDECVIDVGEHYVKRSQRNRARILTAHGPMDLTVHLRDANRPQTPVRDVRIDYSKRWQHQHWLALVSAYGLSPYSTRRASTAGRGSPKAMSRHAPAIWTSGPNTRKTRRSSPSLTCRSFRTGWISFLICRLRTCCSPKDGSPFRF